MLRRKESLSAARWWETNAKSLLGDGRGAQADPPAAGRLESQERRHAFFRRRVARLRILGEEDGALFARVRGAAREYMERIGRLCVARFAELRLVRGTAAPRRFREGDACARARARERARGRGRWGGGQPPASRSCRASGGTVVFGHREGPSAVGGGPFWLIREALERYQVHLFGGVAGVHFASVLIWSMIWRPFVASRSTGSPVVPSALNGM